MNYFKFSLFTLFILAFFGCNNDSEKSISIPVNSTIKVYSTNYSDQKDDLLFFWTPPIGPKNSNPTFKYSGYHNDTMIFTPHSIGIYKIVLSIENMESITLDEVEFYYNITENQFNDNTKKNSNEQRVEKKEKVKTKLLVNKKNNASVKEKPLPPKKKTKKVKIAKPNKYVVQVGAWPSIEQAKIDQKELYEEGFDAYIEKYFFEKRQSFWYRVRIGDFDNKSKAEEVKRRVDKIRPSKSWLTKK